MAITKTYQALIYKELDTYIMANGQKVLVTFRGGSYQPRRNGIYMTSDPEVIKAMDQSKSNGLSYQCISVTGEPEPEVPKAETPNAEVKKESKKEAKEEAKAAALIEVPGVNNLQEAKSWLAKNVEGISLTKLMNGPAVKKAAAQHGIVFTELK